LSSSKVLLLAFFVRSSEYEWSPLPPTLALAISRPRRCIQLPVTRTAGTSAAVLVVLYREMSSTGVSPATAQILVRLVSEVPLFDRVSCEVM
jgi:hypothetical protein